MDFYYKKLARRELRKRYFKILGNIGLGVLAVVTIAVVVLALRR